MDGCSVNHDPIRPVSGAGYIALIAKDARLPHLLPENDAPSQYFR